MARLTRSRDARYGTDLWLLAQAIMSDPVGYRDPWARREAWRKASGHGSRPAKTTAANTSLSLTRSTLSSREESSQFPLPSCELHRSRCHADTSRCHDPRRLQYAFPGLGIATVAFGAYLFVDYLTHPASLDKLKQEAIKGSQEPSILEAVRGRREGSEKSEH